MKNVVFAVIMLLLVATMPAPAIAQGYNETIRALNQSRLDMQDLIDEGFTVLRINDTLSQAKQLFEAQSALEKGGGTPDYSLILERTNEITELRKQAERTNDELKALESRVKEIGRQSEANAILAKAKAEFADERYDIITNLIEEAYIKISEEEALETRFRAIYTAGTKTIFDFFKKRWKEITFAIISIAIIYLVFRKRVAIFFIKRKIKELGFEKEIIGELIKKTQYEYFHLFRIPEELYHIRIEKYSELIRDLDRQVPLLVEDIEKIKGVAKKEEAETKKVKKLGKWVIIVAASLFAIIIAGIFLILYFEIGPYSKILGLTQNLGLSIKEGMRFFIDTFGIVALFLTLCYFWATQHEKGIGLAF